VSPANTAVGLTKPGLGMPGEPDVYRPTGRLNYVRVVPADDLQGPLSADWVRRRGVRKVYILDDNEVYGKGIADLFDERCREIGIEVLGHDSIDAKAQEFKSLMASVKAAGPDLVYFGGTTQSKGGQLAKDMVNAGIPAVLMVPDGCLEQVFIDSAGAANLEGRCFATFGGLPPDRLTGKGADFVARYRERHGELPEAYAVYGYGAQLVEVEVDIRLGTIRLLKITAAHDVGRAINPTLAEGQIEGGIAQGIGMALMEDYIAGRTENLHDYLIPTTGDVPPIESLLIEVPDPNGPFGAKGLGEHVLIPTAPAILNAIRHACGAEITQLPALPHRVLAAIRKAYG
jgi:hypothetical protein